MKNKINLFIFLPIFFICLFVLLTGSYARFSSMLYGGGELGMAKWEVSVNTENIINKTVLTENMTFTVLENVFTTGNKLAPSSQGYFDIVIDASACEVTTQYEIYFDEEDTIYLNMKGFEVLGYEINPTSVPNSAPSTLNSSLPIKRVIPLNKINPMVQKETIRVYGEWIDDGNSDVEHTYAGLNFSDVSLSLTVKVSQYIKE